MQGLLAVFVLMAGFMKISGSQQEHMDSGHLKPGDSITPIRILGILELLGCVGISVQWLTGIAPILTPITAVCFCLVMASGLVVHAQKKEYKMLPMLVVVFALVAVVAYYRFQS